MNGDLVQAWLEVFERQKSMGERAAAQVGEAVQSNCPDYAEVDTVGCPENHGLK